MTVYGSNENQNLFVLKLNSKYGFPLSVRNENAKNVKVLKNLLHLLKKCWNLVVLNAIEKNIEKYWSYWTLLKKYWKILILIEPF